LILNPSVPPRFRDSDSPALREIKGTYHTLPHFRPRQESSTRPCSDTRIEKGGLETYENINLAEPVRYSLISLQAKGGLETYENINLAEPVRYSLISLQARGKNKDRKIKFCT